MMKPLRIKLQMAMKRKMPAGIGETGLKQATGKGIKPAKAKAVPREKGNPQERGKSL